MLEPPDGYTLPPAACYAEATRPPDMLQASRAFFPVTDQLDSEDFSGEAPRLALAKALSIDQSCSTLPKTIDLLHDLDACLAEQDGDNYSIHLNWLHAIFSLVDANHDGEVSRAEWDQAVTTINANLPEGGTLIDAEQSWALLDINQKGYITTGEWDSVLLDVSLTNR